MKISILAYIFVTYDFGGIHLLGFIGEAKVPESETFCFLILSLSVKGGVGLSRFLSNVACVLVEGVTFSYSERRFAFSKWIFVSFGRILNV